jgi:hypothetical protein
MAQHSNQSEEADLRIVGKSEEADLRIVGTLAEVTHLASQSRSNWRQGKWP